MRFDNNTSYHLVNRGPNCAVAGNLGPDSIYRCRLTSIGIPMLKIRRSRDRLVLNMEIPIPGKDGLYIETGPWQTASNGTICCMAWPLQPHQVCKNAMRNHYWSRQKQNEIQILYTSEKSPKMLCMPMISLFFHLYTSSLVIQMSSIIACGWCCWWQGIMWGSWVRNTTHYGAHNCCTSLQIYTVEIHGN